MKPTSPEFNDHFLKSMIVRVGKRSEYLETYYGETYLMKCLDAPEVNIRINKEVFKQHQLAFKNGPIKGKKKDYPEEKIIKPPQH